MSGDKNQKSKFKEAAREVGASEDADAFDDALKQLVKVPPPPSVGHRQKRQITHVSDCAMHNAPAFKAEACDCGAT